MARVLIVLPVMNEEVVLAANVRALAAWCAAHLGAYEWRIVVGSNGSTDRTEEIARSLAAEDPHLSTVALHERGRGRLLRTVWTDALQEGGTRSSDRAAQSSDRASILAYMDVDLSADLAALPALLDAVRDGAAVAYGSRFEDASAIRRSALRELTSRGYLFLARGVLGIKARDLQCGFKAVSADAWRTLKDRVTHPGWFFDTELLLFAERLGMKTVAVPVSWVETRDARRKSTVRLVRTVLGYIGDVARMRMRLRQGERSKT